MKAKITADHIILFVVELSVGITFGGLAAAILVPLCISARGYFSVGGEWAVISFIAYAAYSAFNNWFFKKIARRYI